MFPEPRPFLRLQCLGSWRGEENEPFFIGDLFGDNVASITHLVGRSSPVALLPRSALCGRACRGGVRGEPPRGHTQAQLEYINT